MGDKVLRQQSHKALSFWRWSSLQFWEFTNSVDQDTSEGWRVVFGHSNTQNCLTAWYIMQLKLLIPNSSFGSLGRLILQSLKVTILTVCKHNRRAWKKQKHWRRGSLNSRTVYEQCDVSGANHKVTMSQRWDNIFYSFSQMHQILALILDASCENSLGGGKLRWNFAPWSHIETW